MSTFFKVPDVDAEEACAWAYKQEYLMMKLREAVQLLAEVDNQLTYETKVSAKTRDEIHRYFGHQYTDR